MITGMSTLHLCYIAVIHVHVGESDQRGGSQDCGEPPRGLAVDVSGLWTARQVPGGEGCVWLPVINEMMPT